MLLGADDQGGDAVVDLVGNASPLLLARVDHLLDEPCELVRVSAPSPPRPEQDGRHADDQHDLQPVQHQPQRGGDRLGRHLEKLIEGDAEEHHGEGEFAIPVDRVPDDAPRHRSSKRPDDDDGP
jgi:hypothetical protein